MRFKTDENVPLELTGLLQSSGHDAASVHGQDMAGAKDAELWAACVRERRVLITLDLGFADIRAQDPPGTPGVIVLRLRRQDRESVLRAFQGVLGLLGTEDPAGSLWIAEESRVRIHGGQACSTDD